MTPGPYMRVWSEDGIERYRCCYVHESGVVVDLRKASTRPLAWYDGQPGEWVQIEPRERREGVSL